MTKIFSAKQELRKSSACFTRKNFDNLTKIQKTLNLGSGDTCDTEGRRKRRRSEEGNDRDTKVRKETTIDGYLRLALDAEKVQH